MKEAPEKSNEDKPDREHNRADRDEDRYERDNNSEPENKKEEEKIKDKEVSYLISKRKNFKQWNKETSPVAVKPSHNFTIRFNKKLDLESLKDNIFIIDKNGEKCVEFKIELGQDGTSIIIKPISDYSTEKTYMLVIKDLVKNDDKQQKLQKSIVMYFNTKK